jgi:serine/threonine protein kinase
MFNLPRDRWKQIEALVDQALDRPMDERAAFVRAACGQDAALRQAVEDWLAACENPTLFPEVPAAIFAAPLIPTSSAETAPCEPDPAPRIGAYRILRELGRGGMGTVFLAERADGQLDRRVALKLMRRGTGSDAQLHRRFLEERQILARLEHPHIATLLDGDVTADGQPFFVMQYVEGSPIDRFCDDGRLSVDARLRVFLNVCAAVQHAHRHQVVHRDLKPGNILVAADGQPKLLDFGIAKLLGPAAPDAAQLTRTGERLLTPEYASPEQIRGEAVTPASDVYALGVLLHGLLSGRRPFRRGARTPHELERAILEEEPTQPSAAVTGAGAGERESATAQTISQVRATTPDRLRRRLRGDLDAIVLTALRKDPAQRYADAGQLADDIERHLQGLPIRARGRAPAYRLRALARRHRMSLAMGALGMLAGATLLAVALARRSNEDARLSALRAGTPVLAIGRIADYRQGRGESVAPLADMLATNLARTQGLAVISAGRMYELLHQLDSGEPTEEVYVRAARRAGATEILMGALYTTGSGGVRLDLQRVDVASGNIAGAHTATGADLFALADSATLHLVGQLGLAAPPGSIADVTTRSLAAYRHYSDGLQHFFASRSAAAEASFQAALREDSTFAMAWYYHARSLGYQWRFPSATSTERQRFARSLARALRLAASASDRERLMIRTYNEAHHLSPALQAVAETLAVRYPQEIDGHLMLGVSLNLQGDFRGAIPNFTRVLDMDSAALRAGTDGCAACTAFEALLEAYVLMDSLDAAVRHGRRWLALKPESPLARGRLIHLLDATGRFTESDALFESGRVGNSLPDSVAALAKHWLRAGQLARAESLLRQWLTRVDESARAPLLYFHAMTLRNQGRLQEALVSARRLRALTGERADGNAAPPSALVEAQMLLELGRHHEAAVLFDSIARWPAPGQPASARALTRVQALTMMTVALHAARDTSRLAVLADSLESDGQRALMFRPRDQHHFVRGLLLAARGHDAAAARAFERALATVNSDFARANLELAGVYLRQGRARDAIAVLRPAARGLFLETTNLHTSLTEVHERLAHAWERAGEPDSAAVYWRRVARDWEPADPFLEARQRHAQTRAAIVPG